MVIADMMMLLMGVVGFVVFLEIRRPYLRMRLVLGLSVMLVLFATWLYQVLFVIHWS
jgi:hypothetical protein